MSRKHAQSKSLKKKFERYLRRKPISNATTPSNVKMRQELIEKIKQDTINNFLPSFTSELDALVLTNFFD